MATPAHMPRMNILFVNATHGWAGVKTWMVELGGFLARRGHTVDAACRVGNPMLAECERREIRPHPVRFGPDFSPLAVRRFVRLLRHLQTDVIVTNISKDIRTAGVAARLLGIAHVNRPGSEHDIRNAYRTRLIFNTLVDRVFVTSRGLLAHYRRFPFLRGKLRQFPNAVVPPPWRESGHSSPRFAILARLTRRKQVDRVIETFSRIRDLPWELHVGGDGPELPSLVRQVASLGLNGRVCFASDVTNGTRRIDPEVFLHDKDAGILYSASEPFGWALLEYLANSCAVVASAVDGPCEIIRHGIDGLLVDPNDTSALEDAIRLLIQSPAQRRVLARNGYERVCREFHQDLIFPRIEEALGEAVEARRPRSLTSGAARGSTRPTKP